MDVKAFQEIIPLLSIVGIVVLLFYIVKTKQDGKAVLKSIFHSRLLFFELLITYLNIVEAMLAGALSQDQDLSYMVRMAFHMSLAMVSIVAGLSVSNAVRQAIEKPAIREFVKVFNLLAMMIVGSGTNLYFIALSLNAKTEMLLFLNGSFSALSNPTLFASIGCAFGHILAIIYLGVHVYDEIEDEHEANVEAAAEDNDDDDVDDVTSTEVIPTYRIPNMADVINFAVTHTDHSAEHVREWLNGDPLRGALDRSEVLKSAVDNCLDPHDKMFKYEKDYNKQRQLNPSGQITVYYKKKYDDEKAKFNLAVSKVNELLNT